MAAITKDGSIKVVQPGGFGIKNIDLKGSDNTVAGVLKANGISTDGYQVRVNNNPSQPNQVLNPGDAVLLLQQVKGNKKTRRVVKES